MRSNAVITSITGSPVSLQEMKIYLKLDGIDDDSLVMRLINAAVALVVKETGYALGTMTVKQTHSAFPCTKFIELDYSPIKEITTIRYKNSDGDYKVWSSTEWQTALNYRPALVGPKPNYSWPSTQTGALESVEITYTVGGSTAGDTTAPDALRQAVMLLVAYWYENREDVALSKTDIETARAWRALCAPWRQIII